MPSLRSIPSVNELLEKPQLKNLVDKVSHNVVVTEVRAFLDNLRQDVRQAASEITVPSPNEMAERIAQWIAKGEQPSLRPVINATGIILHTGLGRAPLAKAALEDIIDVANGYGSVEVDIETGQRSQRVRAVERRLRELTGAEAAAVCNNNAGATLLTLAALAAGRQVIVSRGQLIEIGGSYRLPDVMQTSGAVLCEVGTTNKTRSSDYEQAIDEHTAALLRVHSSNYKIVGFTQEVEISELVEIGHKHELPVIDDIGSGAVVDFEKYGLPGEPIARESIQAGADIVLFSGDKLLGGPQCGIIVGSKKLIDQISRHPLMRALRVDKLTLAALAATLRLYRDQETAEREVPTLALLSTSLENLKNRAERLAEQMAVSDKIESAETIEDVAYLGGGSVPTQQLPTWCVGIQAANHTVDELAAKLRTGKVSVFGRVHRDRLLLDLRSVFPSQDDQLAQAIHDAVAS